jgi:4-hydroxybenzoate polyprenyltransferase
MFIYPLFKRITYYPQVVLGFAFNIGVLMGFYAVSPGGGLPLLLIYGALIIWTVCYDTIYAMQDIKDDIKLGLKSTAVKFNEKYKIVLCALSLIFFVLLIAFWRVFHLGYGFLICSSLSFFVLNFLIIRSDTENFNRTFKLNSIIGLLLCLGVVV